MDSAKHLEYCNAATRAGLNYVTDILAGISRRRSGKGWSYADTDGLRIADPVMRKRLNALVIPPAWATCGFAPIPMVTSR